MAQQISVEKAMSDLLRASRYLYLEVPGPVADDVREMVQRVKEVIDAQAAEIEQLKARDARLVRDNPIRQGVTEKEIDEWGIGKPRLISPDEVKRILRSKGLLIEDAPKQAIRKGEPMLYPDDQTSEADPLKVGSNLSPALLAEKHDALVDDVKADCDCLEGKIDMLHGAAFVAALDAAIAALEREGQMESQSSPDLEPVRRLIRAAELMHERQTYEEAVEWDREIAKYAEEALPAMRSILAEIEKLREENAKKCIITEEDLKAIHEAHSHRHNIANFIDVARSYLRKQGLWGKTV